ncbi:excisionase [Planctomycetales bacterium]|nr:excisionase [Planctomycetales bacterium]
MVKPVSNEYYDLEKAAAVLAISPAETNALREKGKLRGFRDGSAFKFRKVDVENYLTEKIKNRNKQEDQEGAVGDEFEVVSGSASSSSFDVLGDLDILSDSKLININDLKKEAAPGSATSGNLPKVSADLDLAVSATDEDSDLALAEETQMSAIPLEPLEDDLTPKTSDDLAPVASLKEDSDPLEVSGDNQSASGNGNGKAGKSDIDLASLDGGLDSEMPNKEHEEGGTELLGLLANESSFDVLEGEKPVDLQVADDESSVLALSGGEDFDLVPADDDQSDDSASSSQVIAVEAGAGLASPEADDDPFGLGSAPVADFGGFNATTEMPTFTDAVSSDPFGGGSAAAQGGSFSQPASPAAKASTEEFSQGSLIAMACALVVLIIPAIMLFDTIANLWSWQEPFILNSVLMDTIAGWFGLS